LVVGVGFGFWEPEKDLHYCAAAAVTQANNMKVPEFDQRVYISDKQLDLISKFGKGRLARATTDQRQ
jgi:hypothetical protein